MHFRFNKLCFLGFLLLFVTEVFIAIFIKDEYIRPFFGDFLVVIMMYLFVKSFMVANHFTIAWGVLLFSFLIEFAQYFRLVDLLGLAGNKFIVIVLGSYFSVIDLLMYVLGIGFVLIVEAFLGNNKKVKDEIFCR